MFAPDGRYSPDLRRVVPDRETPADGSSNALVSTRPVSSEDLLGIKLHIGSTLGFSHPSFSVFSRLHEKANGDPIRIISAHSLSAADQFCAWDPETEVALVLTPSAYKMGSESLTALPGYPIQALADLKKDARIENKSKQRESEFIILQRSTFEDLCHDRDFHNAVIRVFQLAHDKVPMPDDVIDMIRKVRYLSIMDTINREAIDHLNKGILPTLNPERVTISAEEYGRDIPPEEQLWRMLEIAGNFALYVPAAKLIEVAQEARAHALAREDLHTENERANEALSYYLEELERLDEEIQTEGLQGCNRAIKRVTSDEDKQSILRSILLKLSFLIIAGNPSLEGKGRELDGLLSTLTIRLNKEAEAQYAREHPAHLGARNKLQPDRHFEILSRLFDEQIEALFEDLITAQSLPPTFPAKVDKIMMRVRLRGPSLQRLKDGTESVERLERLESRLDRGEESAVGGSAYPRMRYPKTVLREIAKGRITPVHCNGADIDGEDYCIQEFGRHPYNAGILDRCTKVEIPGLYGSFRRSLICHPNGNVECLTSHLGIARMESNAGAQLLYVEPASRKRPRVANMHLVSDPVPLVHKIAEDLAGTLQASEETFRGSPPFGKKGLDPKELPTQIFITLDTAMLKKHFGDRLQVRTFETSKMGKLDIGYLLMEDGGVLRLLMPSTGGYGLYGDCAGAFVEAAFELEAIPNLVPHVLFSATAGVFSGTDKLPEFKAEGVRGVLSCSSGNLIMPTAGIWHKGELLPLPTLMKSKAGDTSAREARREFRVALGRAGVQLYHRHYCVPHPADETFENMERICRSGLVSSVDVEGGHVLEAVLKYQNRGATFTPLYYCSDDPRQCKLNPFLTLAYGGVIHGASVEHKGFPEVAEAAIELAYRSRPPERI